MAFAFEKKTNAGLITISGAFTAAISESFHTQFVAWFQAAPEIKSLVVDLGGVPMMDSTGLGAIIGVLKRVAERGGGLTLARPQKNVQLVLQITQADKIMKITPTLEAAGL